MAALGGSLAKNIMQYAAITTSMAKEMIPQPHAGGSAGTWGNDRDKFLLGKNSLASQTIAPKNILHEHETRFVDELY